jgi:hypothetical protein
MLHTRLSPLLRLRIDPTIQHDIANFDLNRSFSSDPAFGWTQKKEPG